MSCNRYVVQAFLDQSLHVHLLGRFDDPTQSLLPITLDDAVDVESWQLDWSLCLSFINQAPQWVFADEVDAGTFYVLKRLVRVAHGESSHSLISISRRQPPS